MVERRRKKEMVFVDLFIFEKKKYEKQKKKKYINLTTNKKNKRTKEQRNKGTKEGVRWRRQTAFCFL